MRHNKLSILSILTQSISFSCSLKHVPISNRSNVKQLHLNKKLTMNKTKNNTVKMSKS